MIAVGDLLRELERLVREAPTEELPQLVGHLVEAEERARLRLRTATTPPATSSISAPADLITPQAAAAIASVPLSRIYDWARGQRWASRPSRRCLRIDEAAFRRWLDSRR